MDTLLNSCRRLQSLTKLFRFVELCIMVLFLTWISTHLPFAVKISSEYCRKLFTLIFSPISIFCFGNTIVVCLLAKSGLFSGKSSNSIDNGVAQFYDELRSDEREEISDAFSGNEVVFQDKEIICEESIKSAPTPVILCSGGGFGGGDDEECEKPVATVVEEEEEMKASFYRRSKSEKITRIISEEREGEEEVVKEKLRRSETDVCKWSDFGAAEVTAAAEEDQSGEDFRRTIEEFIAKQVKFHREESLAVVIHGKESLGNNNIIVNY